jgi:hypothetical protein
MRADEVAHTRVAPTVGVPAAPQLPPDLQTLLHKLRLPHIRAAAPDIVATAKAWSEGLIPDQWA